MHEGRTALSPVTAMVMSSLMLGGHIEAASAAVDPDAATLRFRTSQSSKLKAAFAAGPVPPIPPLWFIDCADGQRGRDKFKRVDFSDCRAPLPTHAWTKDRKLDQSRLLWHPNNPHP